MVGLGEGNGGAAGRAASGASWRTPLGRSPTASMLGGSGKDWAKVEASTVIVACLFYPVKRGKYFVAMVMVVAVVSE